VEPRWTLGALAGLAGSLVALTAAHAMAVTPPKVVLDRDGLKDSPERKVGLTPGHTNRIAFVDARSRGGQCSDERSAALADSVKTPWCSLARAAGDAPAGTTVLVRGGTYPVAGIGRKRAGRVRLSPYPGERAVLRGASLSGQGIRLEGFHITGTVGLAARTRRIALVGNRWTTDGRSGGTNLAIEPGVRDVLVAANRISQRASVRGPNAINFNSTNTRPAIVAVTIRDNRIGPVAGGGDAIQAKHTRGLTISHNEIFGVRRPPGSAAHPDVFQSIYGATGLTIKDNFIHNIAAQGIFLQRFQGTNRNFNAHDNVIARVAAPWTAFSANARKATIGHNTIDGILRAGGASVRVVSNVAIRGIIVEPEGGVTRERYNLASRFTHKPGAGSIMGGPIFGDAGKNDFRLKRGTRGSGDGPGRRDIGSRRANWSHPVFRRR
jgi:hypothetical protein